MLFVVFSSFNDWYLVFHLMTGIFFLKEKKNWPTVVGRLTKKGSAVSELQLHQRRMLRCYMWIPWITLAGLFHLKGQEGKKIEAPQRGVLS